MALALPHENAILIYADLNAIRSAGLLTAIAGTKSVEELDYRKFVEESGFDYKSDLDRVAVAVVDRSRYAVAVGRFNWLKIKQYALQSGARCINSVCEVKGNPLDNLTSFYPLQDSAMAVASSPNEGGAHMISGRKSGADARSWPSAPVWIRVPGSTWRDPTKMPTGIKLFASALAPSKHTDFTIEPEGMGKQLALRMRLYCDSPQDAARIRQQLDDATALLRKMLARDTLSPKPADLAGLLIKGSFQIEEGTRVTGHWPLEMALVQAIADGSVE